MKRFLTTAGYPAIASALALVLGATSPTLGQNPNYDLPGYIPNRGTATGGPAGGPDQRQFVPGGSTGGRSGGPDQRQFVREGATGGRSGGPDQRKVKRGPKKARKAKKPQ